MAQYDDDKNIRSGTCFSAYGDKPARVFRPSASEILKFCHRADGRRQYEGVKAALQRLKATTIPFKEGRYG